MTITRDAVLARLRSNAERLRSEGIGALYLFGSVQRGENGPTSDVDLYFDYTDPAFSLIDLVRLRRIVSTMLEADADLISSDSLHPALRDRITAGAERVF